MGVVIEICTTPGGPLESGWLIYTVLYNCTCIVKHLHQRRIIDRRSHVALTAQCMSSPQRLPLGGVVGLKGSKLGLNSLKWHFLRDSPL
jgi:hypothetical protein